MNDNVDVCSCLRMLIVLCVRPIHKHYTFFALFCFGCFVVVSRDGERLSTKLLLPTFTITKWFLIRFRVVVDDY